MTKAERSLLSAVLHQLDFGEASDLLDLADVDIADGMPGCDLAASARDLKWCRDALARLLSGSASGA